MAMFIILATVPRMFMSLGIEAKPHVDSGVRAPIRMDFHPVLKPREPDGIANNPNVAGTKVIILVANNTNIFIAVPDVVIRNAYRDHRR